MADVCPNCGLPKELCVCNILDRETESKIKVYTKKAKFDKYITVVEGISLDEIDKTAKSLKRILACGGTAKGALIELQGEHKAQARKALVSIGYRESSIEVA
ncbi:MAG: stress response translation initiation inhibitor YciH [Candidatus Micrarchaeota archaeon]|nr:stress response translation initiation inhibitor YciH [Candidatus Micrarchaeota archaeon]